MSKYADVAKSAKDLLSKSFGFNNSVEAKVPTKTGSTYTVNATVSGQTSASVSLASAVGDLKVDKLQVGSDKKVVGEFSYAQAFPGTKLTFKATDASRGAKPDAKPSTGIAAVVGAEVAAKPAFITADFDAINYSVAASALATVDGFLVGASGSVAFADKLSFPSYDVLVGYKGASFTTSLATEARFEKLTAAYYQDVSSDVKVGAIAKLPRPGAKASDFTVEAALAYKLAPDTWFTGKVNHLGHVGLSYAQQVSPLAKLTFATEVHAASPTADVQKFGITLNLTA